ncbi:Zinc finger protein [Armadillidium vulgare]|nr:Zinc finger protein [Armadillidium vulgare]
MFFQETNLEHTKHYEENINNHSGFIDVIQHESGGVRTYRCPLCPYESHYGESNVKKHMKYKHTGEKPFLCPSCPKRFTEKSNLQKHLVVHTQEKPFPCNTCFKEFKHLSSLNFHIRTQHLMK